MKALLGIRSISPKSFSHEAFSQTVLQRSKLRLVNWNIAKNNHEATWQRELMTLLNTYRPDFLCLQEVSLNLLHPQSFAVRDMGWHLAPNFCRQQQVFGVLTASMVRHHRYQSLQTDHYEPILKTPKAALITEYPLAEGLAKGGQRLLVTNVHGINFVRTEKFQAQLHQIETHIAHHSGPLILSGDFNTWNLWRMKQLTAMVQRLNLRQVTFRPDCHRQLKRLLRSDPLDHVFYRDLSVVADNTRVLSTSASDHTPMCVEFVLS